MAAQVRTYERDGFRGPAGACSICKNPLVDHDLVQAWRCSKKREAMDIKNAKAREARKKK